MQAHHLLCQAFGHVECTRWSGCGVNNVLEMIVNSETIVNIVN